LAIILPANTLAAGGFSVDNSCRFNTADNAKLTRTLGTPTDRDKWTWSAWVKVAKGAIEQGLFFGSIDANNYTEFYITETANILLYNHLSGSAAGNLKTTRLFRDPSAWYHIVVVWDSGNATEASRVKIYVNGVQETSLINEAYPSQDANSTINGDNLHEVGAKSGTFGFGGYMSEVCFVDGQALTPSSFGEYDEDSPTIWKPKDVSGLTFGTNGFYLDFKDSANLGNDAQGGTDWSESNIAADDQCLDSPTNNFCTLNPLDVVTSSITFAHGNTQAFWASTAAWRSVFGTMAPSSGKWYYEVIGGNSSGHLHAAIVSPEYAALLGPTLEISTTNSQPSYSIYGANGSIYYSNTSGAGNSSSYAGGDPHNTHTDYIGCYFDLDNNKLYFAKNGTVLASGTGFDIEAGFAYMPGFSLYNQTAAGTGVNFGNGNFLGTAISGTTYNDANGYGIFKYDPSAGTFDGGSKEFLALCTKNLANYG
jgi:hypothetical protein